MRFGIEIEFTNTSNTLRDIAAKVNSEVIASGYNDSGCTYAGYTHAVHSGWKIVTDASLPRGGGELVSPILEGDNGMMQLKVASEALIAIGCTVNLQCGVHVHHDATNLNVNDIKNVLKLYIKFEKAIDLIMPLSRRNGRSRWCATNNIKNDVSETFKGIDAESSIRGLAQSFFGSRRYYNVNLMAYLAHGTIEFRQHGGTLEFEKIEAWVLLTKAIMTRAIAAKNIQPNTTDAFETLMRVASKNGAKAVTKFFRKRRAHFEAA
tara:strand:+ start:5362 stop:6153 length:792 start_codon:yes stop_codon:yes gene_type:complete